MDTLRVTTFGGRLSQKPPEIFLQHVWVSPFPEEDICSLAELIGVDHVLMGSDWPHGEATPEPADYARALKGLDSAAVRRIMRDNALGLVRGTVAA